MVRQNEKNKKQKEAQEIGREDKFIMLCGLRMN